MRENMDLFKKLAAWLSPEPKIVQLTNTVVARKGKSGLKYPSEFNIHIPDLRDTDWMFKIPSKTYLAYKAKTRKLDYRGEHFWRYVTPKEVSLYNMTTYLVQESIGSQWRKQQKDVADLVVDFVHRIPYQNRDQYVKYPVETLCELGGNCVDLSVLGATMLEITDIESCFVVTSDHAFLGVNLPRKGHYVEKDGKKYYTVEMTGTYFPSEPNNDGIGEKSDFIPDEISIFTKKK